MRLPILLLPTLLLIFLLLPGLAAAAAQPSSLSALSDAERSYYDQIFGYTMENLQPGDKYEWKTYSGNGVIHVSEVFTSKSGSACRNYTETFAVQNVPGAYQGVACRRRGEEGWCRLKPGNAHTCAMEDRGFMFSMPSMSVPNSPIGAVGMPDVSAPNVSGPTITTPNVEAPKMPSKEKASQSYADTVTGSAGKAAGSFAGSSVSWFTRTFGR